MKISNTTILINPQFPIQQAGFIQQTKPITTIHDNLEARILSFFDDSTYLFFVSCDNLGFPLHVQQAIEKSCADYYKKPCHVVVSCTHTHFAPDPHNSQYQDFFISEVSKACTSLIYQDKELHIGYQCEPFDQVGKSRISGHLATSLLHCISIYENEKEIATLIIYNCHPTIMHGDTPFFSAEYPGYLISKLREKNPSIFFSFMQGASGDISTRFTRPSQEYSAVCALGDLLLDKVTDMRMNKGSLSLFNSFSFSSILLPINHDFSSLDSLNIPNSLTLREKETIEIGIKFRQQLLSKPDQLQKEAMLSCIHLGQVKIVFAPNELFSSFIQEIDTQNTALVCYSNGCGYYVTDLKSALSYESFSDTLTQESKSAIRSSLKKLAT